MLGLYFSARQGRNHAFDYSLFIGGASPFACRCEAIHDSRPPIDTRPVHAALNGLPVPGAGQAVLAAPR